MDNDTISRQAAIDALIELSEQRDEWDNNEGYAQKRGIDAAICAIEDLPSAQPHEHWIPVTERLPETEDMYLVTRFNGKPMLDVARFYIDEEGSGYFSCDLGDFAYVTAWMMPLPEPYKGGVQEWTMIL